MHLSLSSNRSPLLEKQSPNFNCDGNHNNNSQVNSNNSNNTISKVNSGNTIEPALQQQTISSSGNLDANQKYGFIMGNCEFFILSNKILMIYMNFKFQAKEKIH